MLGLILLWCETDSVTVYNYADCTCSIFKISLYSFGVNQALHLKKLQYFVKNT